MPDYEAITSREEVEISTGWAHEHPGLAKAAVEKFLNDHAGWTVHWNFVRRGFFTITAIRPQEIEPCLPASPVARLDQSNFHFPNGGRLSAEVVGPDGKTLRLTKRILPHGEVNLEWFTAEARGDR